MVISLDALDKKIMNLLIDEARTSYRQIAKTLGVATATVMKRVKNLEKNDVIEGYTTRINYAKAGYDLQMKIDIKLSKGEILEFEKEMAKNPNVYSIYDVTGEADTTIIVKFKSRKALDKFLKELRLHESVETSESSLILSTVKEMGLKFNV